jgi:ubiquinone biosynthesis protein
MPKLLFDFLELKKEELIINKERANAQLENEKPAVHWNSVAIGAGLSFLLVSLLDYLHFIHHKQLAPLALTGAILTGLFVLFNRSARN